MSNHSKPILCILLSALATSGCEQLWGSGAGDRPTFEVPTAPPAERGTLSGECETPEPEWIWCDDFDQDRLSSYFEYDPAEGRFVLDAAAGIQGSGAMRAAYRPGDVGVGSLKLAFGRTPGEYFTPADAGSLDYREIYWRFYVLNDVGWVGGGGDKLSRATVLAEADWSQAMIAHLWSGGPSNEHLVIDPASGTDLSGNLATRGYNDADGLRWLGLRYSATPVFSASQVGRWHCIEARVRLNDPGQANGRFELWIDGRDEASRTDLNWVGSYDAYGLNAVFLEQYWNDGALQAQERFLDNFVVSTAPIGCAENSPLGAR